MRIFLINVVLRVALMFSIGTLNGQSFQVIRGKIADAGTREPLIYVNLQLKSSGTGTATNEAGEYILKYPVSQLNDTLVVSCIGYQTQRLLLAEVARKANLTMTPATVTLSEVQVSAGTGLDILKEALRRIPENYDTTSVQLSAFYREDIRLGDFQLAYNEAVLDIHKKFRAAKDPNDQIRIVKGRKKKVDFGKDARLYYWMSGVANGARGALAEDLVKYQSAPRAPFNTANYKYYQYDYVETLDAGDHNLIVLDIYPKKEGRRGLIKMRVHLEETSLAIVSINLSLTEQGVRYVSRQDKGLGYAILAALEGMQTEHHKMTEAITYKKFRDKWYLNHVVRHWEILVDSKKRGMSDRLWQADLDFIVTGVSANARPISEGDIGGTERSLTGMLGDDPDDTFWEGYNVLRTQTPDSIQFDSGWTLTNDSAAKPLIGAASALKASNRINGFTRADTLRGKLSPLRTCYDVTFYHLDVDVDVDRRTVAGSNLIRFQVVEPFTRMQLDLHANMQIEKIEYRGRILPYSREFNAVFVEFSSILKQGSVDEFTVRYSGTPKTPNPSIPMDGGILWDRDSLGNVWAQSVTQGSGASLWWPNKDHQSDEPDSMKIWITVPSDLMDVSNGRLIRTTDIAGGKKRFEWSVSYPINNYNVVFNIGKYAQLKDYHVAGADTLHILYYVMNYNLVKAARSFAQVKPMLTCFEGQFGKYPFSRDGFVIMESLYPMEHQSAVSIGKLTGQNTSESNPLLWHEAAHEWWGNAITTKDVADMWIHEGFATYAEVLMIGEKFGKQYAIEELQRQQQAVRNVEPLTGVYNVNHIHYDISDMYSKGCLLVHMLRMIINDDVIWTQLLHGIQAHFRYKTLTADEFVAFVNRKLGADYTYLFDQYLKYTTLPRLELKLRETPDGLELRYRWQADVQNFRMPIRVTIHPDKFDFIHPTAQWQSKFLNGLSITDFEVDQENFYIEVEEGDW